MVQSTVAVITAYGATVIMQQTQAALVILQYWTQYNLTVAAQIASSFWRMLKTELFDIMHLGLGCGGILAI